MKQLEPRNQRPDMQDGLQACIHDPLWLLARQWQLAEFEGDDTGSPVGAQLRLESSPITRYRPGSASATVSPKDLSVAMAPLETCVERENVIPTAGNNLRLAAQAGLHLSRLLDLRGLGKYIGAFLTSFSLKPPKDSDRASLDTGTVRYQAIMAQRVIDGTALYAKLAPTRQGSGPVIFPAEPPFNAVAPADLSAIVQAATDWMNWYDLLFDQPKPGESAWAKQRMEYTFAVSGNTSRGELVLAGPEYRGDRLDWYSFDFDSGQALGATGPVSTMVSAFLPAPVTFRGMPASRYWEMEDGSVNLAKIQAAPHDLARAVLLSFALEFGNDWFLVPVELPVGSLSLVTSLVVTNSFGEKLLLRHTTAVDLGHTTAVDGATPAWRMFGLSPAQQGDPTFMDAFFLAPAISLSLDGASVEEVSLLRDEMASLAWAIERTVESPSGQRLDRHEEYAQKQQGLSPTPGGSGSQPTTLAKLIYRLGSSVPDYWIPFLPVQVGQSIQLRRGSLPSSQPGAGLQPKGRVLDPENELLLHDEEIPREGALLTRSYRYVRWSDGSSHLWVGRRKRPGRGEGSSGLRFDILDSGS
jgi:hypothetical protein